MKKQKASQNGRLRSSLLEGWHIKDKKGTLHYSFSFNRLITIDKSAYEDYTQPLTYEMTLKQHIGLGVWRWKGGTGNAKWYGVSWCPFCLVLGDISWGGFNGKETYLFGSKLLNDGSPIASALYSSRHWGVDSNPGGRDNSNTRRIRGGDRLLSCFITKATPDLTGQLELVEKYSTWAREV